VSAAAHDDAPEAYRLAYDEALHAVASQEAVIENFRGRAGLLLSGAAIATFFLGGQALRTGELTPWSWVAIAVFALLGLATLVILWPWGWTFEIDPATIVRAHIETENHIPVHAIHRELIFHRALLLGDRSRRIRRLVWGFRIAAALLLTNIAIWVLDLAMR
jgi:hypothetical protein